MRIGARVLWIGVLVFAVGAVSVSAQSFSWAADHILLYDTLDTPPNVAGLVPALEHFDFEYEGSDDHHIRRIFFDPPTPGAEPPAGTMFIHVGIWSDQPSFFDYDVGARYLVVPSTVLSPHFSEHRGVRSGKSPCYGSCTVDLGKPSGGEDFVFVLAGFSFEFANDDHHIDTIGIRENDGILTVEFNDKNNDDPFNWWVDFAYLPSSLVNSTASVGQSGVQGSGSAPTGMSSDVVLGGFRLDFTDDDHHIRHISVDTRFAGTVRTVYSDKNADDKYDWVVDLVELN